MQYRAGMFRQRQSAGVIATQLELRVGFTWAAALPIQRSAVGASGGMPFPGDVTHP